MQNRRAAISRRFRFNQPRRRCCDGRPRGGRCRRGSLRRFRLRNGRPAADNVGAGRLAGRNAARAQRPEPSTGIRREGRDETQNEGGYDVQDEGGYDVQDEGGETALSERAMPPRYGPARIGGSRGTAYVDNGQQAQGLGWLSRRRPNRRAGI